MTGPAWLRVHAPVGDVPVYIRAGAVIPMQEPCNTTYETARTPVTLLVTLQPPQQQQQGAGGAPQGPAAAAAACASGRGGPGGVGGVSSGVCQPETQTSAYLRSVGALDLHLNLSSPATATATAPVTATAAALGMLYADDGVALQVGLPGLCWKCMLDT